MKLNVSHKTQYTYAQQVKHSTQYLRLTPQDSRRQKIIHWDLTLPEEATRTLDAYGNVLHVLTLDQPHQTITVEANGVVELEENVEDDQCGHLSPLVFLRTSPLTQADGAIRDFANSYYREQSPHESLCNLMGELLLKMPYTPGSTSVNDTAAHAFSSEQGVCQDHTHVFLSCCRALGIPARYVSGYLYSEDSTHVAMHAWAEAWVNDQWQSFDVTNGTSNPNQHLKLAVGIDYLDACPIRGIRAGGGSEDMQTAADVAILSVPQQ
jgi:transglutaminase-like putative cysteine protease